MVVEKVVLRYGASPTAIGTGFWTFGIAGGDTFARNVVLSPTGRILHYNCPNERMWRLENGCIVLLTEDGRISARLTPVMSELPGRMRFEGEHCLGQAAGPRLALQETEMIYPVYLSWSRAIEDYAASIPFYLAAPYRIRGVYAEGIQICIDRQALLEPYASLPWNSFISMGAYSYCHGSFSASAATIGRYCSVAAGARPFGPSHPMERLSTSLFSYDPSYIDIAHRFGAHDYEVEPYCQDGLTVRIEHDVWIGEDALLKPGITIGTGAVVAARSVVTHDVAPYSVVGGTPARTIRMRFPHELVDALLRSRWWEYNFCDLPRQFSDPAGFVRALEQRVQDGSIQPWTPRKVDIARELLRLVP